MLVCVLVCALVCQREIKFPYTDSSSLAPLSLTRWPCQYATAPRESLQRSWENCPDTEQTVQNRIARLKDRERERRAEGLVWEQKRSGRDLQQSLNKAGDMERSRESEKAVPAFLTVWLESDGAPWPFHSSLSPPSRETLQYIFSSLLWEGLTPQSPSLPLSYHL